MSRRAIPQRRGKHNKAEAEIRLAVESIEAISGVQRVLLQRREACSHRYRRGTLIVVGSILGGIRIRAYTETGVRSIVVLGTPDALSSVAAQVGTRGRVATNLATTPARTAGTRGAK